jgi:hypothetical protein
MHLENLKFYINGLPKLQRPGLGPANKNSQIWEIFRKSQKILNLSFLSKRSEKLTIWCFGLARLLEVYKCSLDLFHMITIRNIGSQYEQSKNLTRIQSIFQGILLVRTKPWQNNKLLVEYPFFFARYWANPIFYVQILQINPF